MVKRARLPKENPWAGQPRRLRVFINEFTEYTPYSILDAAALVAKTYGRVDAVTLEHYLRPKNYGGLGMGKVRF